MALLAPEEAGSTLALSSLRSESVKGFVTRVGTRIVKGVRHILIGGGFLFTRCVAMGLEILILLNCFLMRLSELPSFVPACGGLVRCICILNILRFLNYSLSFLLQKASISPVILILPSNSLYPPSS